MATIHRTAVFTLPQPTRQAQQRLERAFRDYAHAYGTLLHGVWLRYGQADELTAGRTAGLDALRGLATYALDEGAYAPRMSARTLTHALFTGDQLPRRAVEALARLPSRLRQSAREQAGETLLSYVALADAWLTERPSQRGGAPQFPRRLRAGEVSGQRQNTLETLAALGDNRQHERVLVRQLLTTREPDLPAIPFVGVADDYGCALYYLPETSSYYARLDIGSPTAHDAEPLAMYGVYTQIKTGERWASATHLDHLRSRGESIKGIHSFGRRTGCLWLPLRLDGPRGDSVRNPAKQTSYHQRALRFTRAAFLPDPRSGVAPAAPVSAKLVRQETRGKIWYQLHTVYALPPETLDLADDLKSERRPILAINRGLFHLYAAALMTPDGMRELATFAASGRELLARQATLERARQQRQQRGKQPLASRDRRQRRIATHEIHICANQIVEVARQERAQVVFEDLASFASGAAIRTTTQPHQQRQRMPRAHAAALRTLLNRRQFEALHRAVDQRLALLTLPPARRVSAAYISQTCPACGERDARSYPERLEAAARTGQVFDPRQFVCPACGASRDVDTLAAVNIARKLVWLRQRGAEKRGEVESDLSTTWQTFAKEAARQSARA